MTTKLLKMWLLDSLITILLENTFFITVINNFPEAMCSIF